MSHRRCIRACARCRDMKVRCSGTIPCMRCQRGKRECYFRPEDLRTTVPSSYLESLEAQVYGDGRPVNKDHAQRPPSRDSTTQPASVPGTRAAAEGSEGRSSITQEHVDDAETATTQPADDENDNEVNSPEFKRNPLVDSGEVYAQDPGGKFWYMGPTSSWAFCRRVLALIGNSTPNPEPPVYPWDLETIDLNWIPIGLHEQPDVSGLPSQEYALYLLSTVQYHLGSLCEIIDQESFQRSVELFYADPSTVAWRSRYWFSQFLFVLAFGEAFLNSSSSKGIPGTRFASRALSLIPSLIPMDGNKDTLSAVQAHCLAALYLQAVDLRLMAYQIIGQGLRISIIEGWHRYMPPENVGKEHSKRCNTIFWITYIIDQEFGPLVGAPSSIRPEDITARLPSEIDSSHRGLALTLQVRMSRLTATILTGVYGVDKNFDSSLVKDTQSMLHSLADVSRDIGTFLETRFQGTNVRSSKMVTRLLLSYHHCVVLTTRPLVMCVLHRRAAHNGLDRSIPDGPISSLLVSCVQSALSILKTLRTLGESNLLDSFLPFQMEAVFSSAFLLYVIDAVSPGFVPDQTWLATAHGIFDIMIARGSPAAPLRKRELQRLEHAMHSYLRADSAPDSTSLQEQGEMSVGQSVEELSLADTSTYMDDSMPWDLFGDAGGLILSPGEILHLAGEIEMGDFGVDPEL